MCFWKEKWTDIHTFFHSVDPCHYPTPLVMTLFQVGLDRVRSVEAVLHPTWFTNIRVDGWTFTVLQLVHVMFLGHSNGKSWDHETAQVLSKRHAQNRFHPWVISFLFMVSPPRCSKGTHHGDHWRHIYRWLEHTFFSDLNQRYWVGPCSRSYMF